MRTTPRYPALRPQRELRDLTRHPTQLVNENGRTINRIQKVLEDANIKLAASVATDIRGASGRAMANRCRRLMVALLTAFGDT